MRRSLVLMGVGTLLLAGCSTEAPFEQDDEAQRRLVSFALTEAAAEMGATFSARPFRRGEVAGVEALSFEALDGTDVVTVSLLTDGSVAWRASRGAEPEATVDPLTPAGCWVCLKWEYHAGYYKETWVTEVIKQVVGAASAAACAAKGGKWAGAACYVTAKKLVKVLDWVKPWKECVKQEYRPSCPHLIGVLDRRCPAGSLQVA